MSPGHLSFDVTLARGAFRLSAAARVPLAGVTALFGPSGSGKTTLLRTLAGLETGARGRIALEAGTFAQTWLDTAGSVNRSAHRRAVGLVFQEARLFDHLSVMGNLRYADKRAFRRGVEGPAFADVVEALDLPALLSRMPAGLSGGERQRVALGRTLLARPRVLLLDEPFSALDGGRKAALLPYLEAVVRRFAMPALYVSHAMEDVIRLADHVVVLSDGRVLAQGPAAAILQRPDLEPVTGRPDAGVLIEGEILCHDGRYALTTVAFKGGQLTLPGVAGPEAAGLAPGAPVRLRIRARDVSIALNNPEGLSIRNCLPGVITGLTADPHGPDLDVTLQVGGQSIRARITRAAGDALALSTGQSVFALIKSVSLEISSP